MDSKNATTTKPRRSNNSTNKDSNKKGGGNKFLKFLLNLAILIIFFIVIAYVSAIVILNGLKANTIEVTDNNFWQNQSTALVYNAEGDQIGRLSERDVKWVDLCRERKDSDPEADVTNTLEMCGDNTIAKVSPYYVDALIATEDQGYMEHNGVNFKGLFRVTLSALVNGDTSAGGGSSITMQLAKLLYLQPVSMYDADGNKVSWTRNDQAISSYDINYENGIKYKLAQMALALKIEDNYKKDEIMENYVNTMWFGEGGYGIYNAADYYYGVTPNKLSISQAATLAGMTQRPVDWNPYTNPEDTTTRRNTVINRMLAEGYITQAEADEAKAVDISSDLVDHSDDEKETNERIKYYNDVNLYVLDELESLLGESADLATGGMKIHTTIDDELQKNTIDVLDTDNGLIGMSILEGTQTGTAMIDVDTGGILAIGNGFDGESPYAYAYNELRNPGSTAKPLTAYAPAIEYLQWSTAHILNDETTYYSGTSTEVNNYSKSHQGNVTMMKALATSLNTTAVQAFQQVVDEIGIDEMTDWFERIGLENWKIGRESEDDPQVYESYTLGAFGSTPVEMASAFATFANGGTYNEPHIIDYIEFDEQSPYYDIYGSKWYPEYDSHEAMSEETAYEITMMLNPDNDGAFTSNADVSDLDMAIKTGTSNWGANNFGIPESYARDRWTIGYSPDIATAVWYGFQYEYEQDGYMFYEQPEQPLYIFKALMSATTDLSNDDLTDGEFEMPDDIVTHVVNGITHYYIEGSPEDTGVNTAPSAPYVNVSISSGTISIDWDDVDGASSYNVIVNGEVVDTVTKSKAELSYDDLFDTGCSSSYAVGAQSVGGSGLTSGTSTYTLSNDTSNCSDSSDDEDDKDKEDTKEEDTSDDKDKEEDDKDKEDTEEEDTSDDKDKDDNKDKEDE